MAVNNRPGAASPERVSIHTAVFNALRQLLKPYESALALKIDRPGNCYLETHAPSLNGRHLFFAAAKVKKNYVSFYLPALYMFPDLSDKISPTLKKLMQGQSCFNFTSMDHACFEELGRLTESGFQKLKSQSLL